MNLINQKLSFKDIKTNTLNDLVLMILQDDLHRRYQSINTYIEGLDYSKNNQNLLKLFILLVNQKIIDMILT